MIKIWWRYSSICDFSHIETHITHDINVLYHILVKKYFYQLFDVINIIGIKFRWCLTIKMSFLDITSLFYVKNRDCRNCRAWKILQTWTNTKIIISSSKINLFTNFLILKSSTFYIDYVKIKTHSKWLRYDEDIVQYVILAILKHISLMI